MNKEKRIIILRGISCSGKTTWANQQKDYYIVSRDEIRKQILGSEENLQKYFNQGLENNIEELVSQIQEKEIAKHIIKNHKIIIDNTNLKKKYIQEYLDIINDIKPIEYSEIQIKDFDVPLDEALKRNSNRKIQVSESTIYKQFNQHLCSEQLNDINSYIKRIMFIKPENRKRWYFSSFDIEPYVNKNHLKNPCVICDLDGTSSHRSLLQKRSGEFFLRSFYDYHNCQNDSEDLVVKEILHSLEKSGFKIVFVSGRKESARKFTSQFIEEKLCFNKNSYRLLMRQENDNRSDDIIKYEIFNKYLRDENIFCIFDDRKRVIAMWEELGIKVLNCGSLNDVF